MQSVSTFPFGSDFLSAEFPTFRKLGTQLGRAVHDHFIPHARNNYHPHIISHRMLALLSLLLMTVKIAGISLVIISPAAPVEASAITPTTVISLANEARAAEGLGILSVNNTLSKAAQAKANDMLAKQYFAHNAPTGETPWSFIKAAGYSYVTAGENLAIDFTEAESVQTAWMNSPGHRANIMNKSFQEIGIGIAKGMYNGHQTTIVVQMFGTPIAQKVDMTPAPTPVAPQQVAQPVAAEPTPTVIPVPPPVVQQTPVVIPVDSKTELTEVAIIGKQPVEITSTQTALQGNDLYLTVTASSDATKLLATYGTNSIMLNPAENNQWYGYIPLSQLHEHNNLIVYAYDINGNLSRAPVGQFSAQLNDANLHGEVEGASITLFGKSVSVAVWEERIMLIVLAALLTCLLLAIAIRRHVQHVSLIANTSFVAMLAAFMLLI